MSDTVPVPGAPVATKERAMDALTGLSQTFNPITNICLHLSDFHVYADDPTRSVETHHYVSRHLSHDLQQSIIYDSPGPDARLIGIEYIISRDLFETLPADERKYWHSHAFEVSHAGMAVMPDKPVDCPEQAWERAEIEELRSFRLTYGKSYHLWQVDKDGGHALPLGEPKLMMTFTHQDQIENVQGGDQSFEQRLQERDRRFGGQTHESKHAHRHQAFQDAVEIHPDADAMWKRHHQQQAG